MAMQKFAAYYRVSTKRQGQSGLGIEAQKATVRSLISANGNKLIAEFTEVESGKNVARPKVAEALAHCKITGATLIVAKLDRLSRNAAFLLTLRDSGVPIMFADMPQADKFTVGVLAMVAEREREVISKNTKDALAAAKARGITLGNPKGAAPLVKHRKRGRRKAAQVVTAKADDFAQRLAPIIVDIRTAGIDTANGIARALNARDVETPRGGQWSAVQVRRVLARLD
jgi:DNA invertase Pin-like site-specific DNA recombinase